jgi:hypothetical protein
MSVPIHSAHVGAVFQVQYRWHAYFGCDVKIYRTFQRGDGGYVALEREAGVAIMAPVWILDASICKTMTLGSPVVSLPALLDLQAILRSQGFRRGFDEDDSSKETGHDPATECQTGATAPAISPQRDGKPDRQRTRATQTDARSTPALSSRYQLGGGNR